MTSMEYMQSNEYTARQYTGIAVPLTFLLQNIVASCDADILTTPEAWLDLIEWKSTDGGFHRLVDSIIENGLMSAAPIGIEYIEDDYYGEGLYINEGHHRLVAAILLGLDEVWIAPRAAWGESPGVPAINAHN